ncbi:MAG: hypothetical protein Q9214_003113 [Letrouitia sp. 1 TL-2023]
MNDWHWNSDIRSSISSKAWQRVSANALVPTVVTTCSPEEALSGCVLHWDANRTLTVMEARRAQGFPDHEVIVGSPAMQWKIIGNSVSRQVATAWGMSVRAAWFGGDAMRQVQNCSNTSYLELGNEGQGKDKCNHKVEGIVKNEVKDGDEDDDEDELAKAVTAYNSRVMASARIINQPINSRTSNSVMNTGLSAGRSLSNLADVTFELGKLLRNLDEKQNITVAASDLE